LTRINETKRGRLQATSMGKFELADCDRYIADLQDRLAGISAASNMGSGFIPHSEIAQLLERTLEAWQQRRETLLRH